MNLPTRANLRHQLRSARRQLTRHQQLRAARHLCQRLSRMPQWRNSHRIGFYWPADGEISPLPLLRLAARQSKTCYLPRIHRRTYRLSFHRYAPGQKLKRNHFGIPEPLNRPCALAQLDLVLMPLVGFDTQGNRLGMGGGFYDRLFARHKRNRPWRLGLAHDLQRVPQLPAATWDVPMHGIVTDAAIYRI